MTVWMQVHCLKELRELEASGGTPTKHKDYVPDNLEVKALLSRDKNITDDLYKAAVADTLIITMKARRLLECNRAKSATDSSLLLLLVLLLPLSHVPHGHSFCMLAGYLRRDAEHWLSASAARQRCWPTLCNTLHSVASGAEELWHTGANERQERQCRTLQQPRGGVVWL